MRNTATNIALISMSRSGHRAVMEWMGRIHGSPPRNIESKPFKRSIELTRKVPVLLLRSYPNWLASIVSHFPDHSCFDVMIDKWVSHAKAAATIPTILFERWVKAGHGDDIDIGKTFGSFTKFDSGSVLTRGAQMRGNPTYDRLLSARTDAVAANDSICWGTT